MREKKTHIYVDSQERTLLFSLLPYRNDGIYFFFCIMFPYKMLFDALIISCPIFSFKLQLVKSPVLRFINTKSKRDLLLHSLVELKNQLIQQGRYTDCIDEIIFKAANAPVKRMKIEYV